MKKLLLLLPVLAIMGCAKQAYPVAPLPEVPREVHTETRATDNLKTDSVYVYEKQFIYLKGDTTYLANIKTVYKDRVTIRADTVIVVDSIPVPQPYPVEVVKPIPKAVQVFSYIGIAMTISFIFLIITFISIRHGNKRTN